MKSLVVSVCITAVTDMAAVSLLVFFWCSSGFFWVLLVFWCSSVLSNTRRRDRQAEMKGSVVAEGTLKRKNEQLRTKTVP